MKLNQIKRTTFKWGNPNLTRNDETIINRLRIKHSRLTHGYLMSKKESLICEVCGSQVMIKHILMECQQV